MPIKAVQQFMLGNTVNSEKQAWETLATIKNAGYDAIELCGFMSHPSAEYLNRQIPAQRPIRN